MIKVSLSELKVTELILRKNTVVVWSESSKKYNLEGATAVNIKTIISPLGNKTEFTIYCTESGSSQALLRCRLTLTRSDTGPYIGELVFLNKHV